MKLLISDKEIAQFLSSQIDYTLLINEVQITHTFTSEAIGWALEKKGEDQYIPKKHVKKAKDKIKIGIQRDLKNYLTSIKEKIKLKKKTNFSLIYKNINYLIEKLGSENILKRYKQSNEHNFVKSVGLQIDKSAKLIRRSAYKEDGIDCLIRNTTGNENALVNKIDNCLPFWFIDSGYTNFIEHNKKWHRLVRNHLHYGKYFNAPSDRLSNFASFPNNWRHDGDIILVIEPGPFAANIFHIDIHQWKYNVETELRKYTDKKIKFREKFPKKQRTKLYNELLNEDYYCVININSNAATESIWAGVPVITLDKHITNPVSKNQISEINNLYRGPLGNWLSYLSYSQFTYDELINGTALNIIRKWHV
jgi:hypothetical protein